MTNQTNTQPASGGEQRRPARRPSFNQRPRTAPSSKVHRRLPAREGSEMEARFHGTKAHSRSLTGEGVKMVPLGGLEEVGRNMMFFEYKDEIIIVDMGIQFPDEETPGIDYIIPNTAYLESKKENIKAVILTHAHLDHVGAVSYLMDKIGNPPIYTSPLTRGIILKRHEEFINKPKLNIELVKAGDVVKISKYFEVEFFWVSHTVPDTTGIVIKTPAGKIVHFADFRIEYDEDGKPHGIEEIERVGKMDIDILMLDSTNAEKPGVSISEKIVEKNLEEIFRKAEGRIIVGIFASLVTRIGEIIKIAEKLGRKVALNGRSMKDNIAIAQNLGYIKGAKGTVIPIEDINKFRDENIMILSTGAQGEPNAGLTKMVNGEHRQVRLKTSDEIIFSSSAIPGNERSIQVLKDNLARQGAHIYHSKLVDVHASGHAPQEDLKLVMKLIKPRYLVPVHGHYFMRAINARLGQEVGISKENAIMIDNGQVIELLDGKAKISEETVPAYYVMVDGLGVGDVGEIVLRDRRVLAQEGMLVVITTIDRHSGRVLKNPDIISRGFIYLKENQEILNEIRKKVRRVIENIPKDQEIDSEYIKGMIRDQIGQYLFNKTQRRPMILPVVIEI